MKLHMLLSMVSCLLLIIDAYCLVGHRALHGPGGPARAGPGSIISKSHRAGLRNYWAGPSRAGQHTARKIAIMTSLISDSINRAV